MELIDKVQQRFGEMVQCSIEHEQLIVELCPSDIIACCKALRDENNFKFELLIDVCGVDYLEYGISDWATDTASFEGFSRGVEDEEFVAERCDKYPARFAVVYQLLSLSLNQRIRLRSFVQGDPLRIPSVTELWAVADWYEREVFDLYGILFDNHPDLRRILTDYGFVGHPFRKDFPLIGEVEMRYDATLQRVVYEPVSITPRILVPKVIKHVRHES